jgi:hypothetical protein
VVLVRSVHHGLSYRGRRDRETGHPVDDVHDQVEPIQVVQHDHVERCRGGALLEVAADVQVAVVGPAVRQPVDQPRVAVVGEDDRPVGGEYRVELGVGEPVRVFGVRLHTHQVDHVDHADPEVRQVLAEQVRGGERLHRRHVTGAGEHHVGIAGTVAARVVGGPFPDADAACAVRGGGFHVQPLRGGLFAGDDDVDVVPAVQAVVGHSQQGVRVRRQVHPDDACLLVDHVVDESGVLV